MHIRHGGDKKDEVHDDKSDNKTPSKTRPPGIDKFSVLIKSSILKQISLFEGQELFDQTMSSTSAKRRKVMMKNQTK